MQPSRKDALTDVAQNLPQMQTRPPEQPEGTVIAADGTVITLGEEGMTRVINIVRKVMNRWFDKYKSQ